MAKKDIFSKIIKNYNDELEKILEKKAFDSNVKNLLLSMLYKIDSSYDDYKKVKVNVCSKDQFINEILDTIENKCNEIEFIKPTSEEGQKFLNKNINCIIDKQSGKIKAFQNEKSLLDAILQMRQEEIELNEKYDLTNKPIKEMLLIGNNMNSLELITDFNGWSWDITTKGKKNTIYNCLYQLLIILIGNKKIESFINNRKDDSNTEIPNNLILSSKYNEDFGITKKEIIGEEEDYVATIRNLFKDKYGEENEKEFFKRMMQLSILECKKNDIEYKVKIQNKVLKLKQEFKEMKENKTYIEKLTQKKKEITKKIEELDFIINNDEKLKEEYHNRNEKLKNEHKIFSPSHLRLMLKKQRETLLDEIQKINKSMEPQEYIKKKEILNERLKFYEEINLEEKSSDNIRENTLRLLELYKEIFEKCMLIKIEKAQTNEEISNIIYELRYYILTQKNSDESDKSIENLKKMIIKKACEKKILTLFSEEEDNINEILIKPIFTSRIIDLDAIAYMIKYTKGIISLNIYDGNTHDETKKIELKQNAVLNVKLNKKIKLWQ